jgi:hypothetical protein
MHCERRWQPAPPATPPGPGPAMQPAPPSGPPPSHLAGRDHADWTTADWTTADWTTADWTTGTAVDDAEWDRQPAPPPGPPPSHLAGCDHADWTTGPCGQRRDPAFGTAVNDAEWDAYLDDSAVASESKQTVSSEAEYEA